MIRKIISNKLVKQTGTLASGAMLAQIIGLLATPVLSRYYFPEDFGLLGSILTLAGIIAVILSLKYEMAIVLTEKRKETYSVVGLSLLIMIGLFFIISSILIKEPSLLKYMGVNNTSTLIVIVLLLITLGLGVQNILYQWHTKLENYGTMSKNKVIQKMSIVFLQLVIILLFSNHFGLIWGFTLGLLISLLVLILPLKQEIKSLKLNKHDLIRSSKKYFRFPLYTAPQNLLNAISQGLPVLLLGYFFDLKTVGFYFFAVRILQLPSSVIGGSIRQVFYKRASDLRTNIPQLFIEFKKTTFGLLCLIIVPVIIIFMFGPELFSLCFGSEWEKAGEMAKWMMLWIGLMFVNPPSNAVLLALNKNNNQLVLDILLISIRALALYIGGSTGDIIYTIKLFSIVGLFFNIILITISYNYLRYGNSIWR